MMYNTSTMKEMVYTADRLEKPIILDKGNIDGFSYLILNFGTHPTAYVSIPIRHPFYKKDCDDIDIDCHGGLTFSKDCLEIDLNKKVWWIGWDYAHTGDYLGFLEVMPSASLIKSVCDKKWATEEILSEVKNVIEQLKAANQ